MKPATELPKDPALKGLAVLEDARSRGLGRR